MIPNTLWQTWKNENIPQELNKCVFSWKLYNKQLRKHLVTDTQASKFILDNFGQEVHDLYEALPQPIMRADFWRVAAIYINGGFYCDLDVENYKNISELHNENTNAIFIKEHGNIANFFFAASKNHPILKLALDYMIEEAKSIASRDTQSFGMHNFHRAVLEYCEEYREDDIIILEYDDLRNNGFITHNVASMKDIPGYSSWRANDKIMQQNRYSASDIIFFTTFNNFGYELYGKTWLKTFTSLANYYPSFYAKIYYEGKPPSDAIKHPNVEWVNFNTEIPRHAIWKTQWLARSNHDEYIKKMTLKFSFKAFVIQHMLSRVTDKYLVWLDGDCVFLPDVYKDFPQNILRERFLSCQIEEAHGLNHVESGILVFDPKHPDTKTFNHHFIKNYEIKNILDMSQPYDGFLLYKSLLTSNLQYVDLNKGFGRGGIQSDPGCTFLNPELKNKFIHNIGWTGKNSYENWNEISSKDSTYTTIRNFLFGDNHQSKQDKMQGARQRAAKLQNIASAMRSGNVRK